MKCPSCNEIIPDNAETCPECGEVLPRFGFDIVEEKEKGKRDWTKFDTYAVLSILFPCFSLFALSLLGFLFAGLSFKKAKYRWTAILGFSLSAAGTVALAVMIPLFILNH